MVTKVDNIVPSPLVLYKRTVLVLRAFGFCAKTKRPFCALFGFCAELKRAILPIITYT